MIVAHTRIEPLQYALIAPLGTAVPPPKVLTYAVRDLMQPPSLLPVPLVLPVHIPVALALSLVLSAPLDLTVSPPLRAQ